MRTFSAGPGLRLTTKSTTFVPSISTTALEQVGTSGIPRSGLSGNNLNFAPRVGFAYKVTNKTVFHAGYGIYYSAPNVTNSSGLSANVPVDNYWAFNNPQLMEPLPTGRLSTMPRMDMFTRLSRPAVHWSTIHPPMRRIRMPRLHTASSGTRPSSSRFPSQPFSSLLMWERTGFIWMT